MRLIGAETEKSGASLATKPKHIPEFEPNLAEPRLLTNFHYC